MGGRRAEADDAAGGSGVAADEDLNRRLRTIALRGLAAAGRRLAGNDVGAVCATLRLWNDRGQRELPWLAGPGFSALQLLGVTLPRGPDVLVVERFLVGTPTSAERIASALDSCDVAAGGPAPGLPPDARGAVVEGTERFFELLAQTYEELHPAVRDGSRRSVDEIVGLWQRRLDSAADDLHFRATRLVAPSAPPARERRKIKGRRRRADRPGLALLFVVVAVLIAAYMLWLVLQGWPAVSVPSPL